jgi:hypothetical protein
MNRSTFSRAPRSLTDVVRDEMITEWNKKRQGMNCPNETCGTTRASTEPSHDSSSSASLSGSQDMKLAKLFHLMDSREGKLPRSPILKEPRGSFAIILDSLEEEKVSPWSWK